ncbi:MAG TPA: hypothetical protein VGH97_12095 [Thermoanaerobaculia bacterium]
MRRRTLPVIAMLLAAASVGRSRDLPEAPEGFHWEQATGIKAALLAPDGWFFREEAKPTVIAYVISREDSKAAGKFETGFTLNVNRVSRGDSVEWAKKVVAEFSKAKKNKLLKSWDVNRPVLTGAGCDVEIGEGRDGIKMELVALGNPRTNAVYLMTFEAPLARWDEAWKLGREMMSHVSLSDEF